MRAEVGAGPADVVPRPLDAAGVAQLLPRRSAQGHKFSFGVVVAVAGSLDYAGAAYMTALGAARAGAGMVALAVPDSLRPLFAGRLPEAIVTGLPEQASGVVEPAGSVRAVLERDPAAIVIGPGLKESPDYAAMLVQLLGASRAPVVVDAGALALLGDAGEWWTEARTHCVLTPHVGEFRRLTGVAPADDDEERIRACRTAADRFGHVVVLKGARTVVAEPGGNVAISPFTNALLATAGSGDVLAGYIGGLLGQGATPFDAACAGVYLHGAAGERLSERLGDAGLLATELALEMAHARHDIVSANAG
jgi:NAD(P)H-hydrate epimerase